MSGGGAYLDASALVKLVRREPETEALAAELRGWPVQVTSAIAAIELVRAVRRAEPAAEGLARHVLAQISLLAVDDPTREAAATVEPRALRTLDAVHLAAARSLGARLGVLVAYDERLLDAAAAAGVPTLTPR